MKPRQPGTLRCPRCAGTDIRKSLTRTLADYVPEIFGFTAMRCRNCRYRFYRRLPEEADIEPDETHDR